MFGISAGEFVVLLAVAAVVLGPERLPDYARQLARLIRELRNMAQGASSKVREEMGPEFDDIDWRKLDPRQYDPRRIVREALAEAFDPDDPLGLNDVKPVSRGGPAQTSAAARASAAASAAQARADGQAASQANAERAEQAAASAAVSGPAEPGAPVSDGFNQPRDQADTPPVASDVTYDPDAT